MVYLIRLIIKDLKNCLKDAINAIKTMELKFRGAPLIGATMEQRCSINWCNCCIWFSFIDIEKNDLSFLKKSSEDLIASRPTAINLKWAVDRMMKKLSGVNDKDILENSSR